MIWIIIFLLVALALAGVQWQAEKNAAKFWQHENEMQQEYFQTRMDLFREGFMARDYVKENTWLRAQLMRLRVKQAEHPRRGWEICCAVPEEVLAGLKDMSTEVKETYVRLVAGELVRKALSGIHRVDAQGRATAIIFPPVRVWVNGDSTEVVMDNQPQSEFIGVLWDKEGKYKVEDVHVRRYDGKPRLNEC